MKIVIVTLILYISLCDCRRHPTPKERGFFRIEFPKKNYHNFSQSGIYSFDLPSYARSEYDTKPPTGKVTEQWQNIYFPKQNGQLHLTYTQLNTTDDLAGYLEDTHKFVYKHTIKADAIDMKEYYAPERKVYGILYNIEGNTASSVQFFLTDSINHFLRGSLYLNEKPSKDSLSVVIDFLRKDVIRLMQTLEWK